MSTLNLRQIQGFILRMYRMPMVRHFLLKVNTPAAARALLGRLASGDERDAPQITTAEEWHVAVPGPEDDRRSASQAEDRLLPQRGHYVARAGRVGSHGSPPPLFARHLQCVRRGRGEARGGPGRPGRERPGDLDQWIRHGQRSCDGHALRLEPGSHGELQHSPDRPVCGGAGLRAPGTNRRHGPDRDPGWKAGARLQGAFRVHRRHHGDASHSRRTGTRPRRSSATLRTVALRVAG